MIFRDRADAGRQLARALAGYEGQRPVILALPRGGVAVAAEVATALHAPLDIILVRKIGAPVQPELAIGAVVDGAEPIIVRNPAAIESTATSEDEFQSLCNMELKELERRRAVFCGDRVPIDVTGRVVIVVDDGIATGATARAAVRSLKLRRPKKIVLAVPVATARTLEGFRSEVDEVVCLEDLGGWSAIGFFYDDFRQLTDTDVVTILSAFNKPAAPETVGRTAARA
jgi:putative phosphoribosyl transferase